MKRLIWIAMALVILAGAAAPLFKANVFRPPIERALERGLGRRVEVGDVYFNLFTGPGFTIDRVTIHEDPRAGIEPFAYVDELEARVRLLGLWSRHLEFSSLRLGSDTSINMVKTDAGPWNFQFLLSSAPAITGRMPSIRMRGGRVNFKFGQTKSVFYFSDADFDVSPSSDRSVELRFSGAPSRTDQAAQTFGHFFVRGMWRGQQLDMRVELEPSALEEVARLLHQHALGMHGVVAFDAQLSGPPSDLNIAGQFAVDDLRRSDMPQRRGTAWHTGYKGTLDLHNERLDLANAADPANAPVALKFRAWDFLTAPHWDASAAVKQIPLGALVDVARQMGAPLPDKLEAEGSVSGDARFSEPEGLVGRVELQNASVTLPDAQPLKAANAALEINGPTLTMEPATVRLGENESAEVEGSFASSAGLNLKVTTRGLNVADLHSFGLGAIPLLQQTPQGSWHGWARYKWSPGAPGEWAGEYELQNARVAVDGLADPIRIQSAAVVSSGARVVVSRLHAKAGAIAFTGEYRFEPNAARPHRFRIAIPEASAAEIARLFAPSVARERGFLARTLRLGPAPMPDWLKARHADGNVSIESLNVGDWEAQIEGARVLWDGSMVSLTHLHASIDPAEVDGDLAIDLSDRAPHFRFDGKVQGVPYKNGELDFEGDLDADGMGAQLLTSAHAEGCLKGRSIAFTPDAEFRSVSGCFEMSPGPRWKITGLEVVQAGETYNGTGSTQTDGRLVLDLTNRGKQVRYTSTLASLAPQ
ncbi:MAG TPA: hypothetical protein VK419_01000 [Bryobacteraceae bacterium]|nr:hypothetical protein [Bryobacteraceae bacterium]